jgi:hypothetical protein
MKVACHEPKTWCPSSCPATKPVDGAPCSTERFTCEYATGICSPDNEQLVDATCYCNLGSFVCYDYCSSSGEALIEDDEFVEVTPLNVRIRKKYMTIEDRRKYTKRNSN